MARLTVAAYLCVGCAVALALARGERPYSLATPLTFIGRLLLWPLFVPLLLQRRGPETCELDDADEARIGAVERELSGALGALGDALGSRLGPEMRRVEALGRALRAASARRRELAAIVARPEHDLAALERALEAARSRRADPSLEESLQRRIEHVLKLAALERQASDELDRTCARASELAARLTLLRYDASPPSRAAFSAQQLASCIDELCSVLAEVRSAGEHAPPDAARGPTASCGPALG